MQCVGQRLRHIAFIMDGNARYAKLMGLDNYQAYRQGLERSSAILTYCRSRGIQYVTLFAFSTENWLRAKSDVDALMLIFYEYLCEQLTSIANNDFRICFRGQKDVFAPSIRELMDEIESHNKDKESFLIIAVNYGGRQEIESNVRNAYIKMLNDQRSETVALMVDANSANNPDQSVALSSFESADSIVDFFRSAMDFYGAPPPDMVVRTGGYRRLSNFMLWDIGYSELFFTQTLWPQFLTEELDVMIDEYLVCMRKFGR